MLRDRAYAERLYSPESIHQLLTDVGFHDIVIQRGAFVYDPDQGTDYGLATNRMLVTAAKGAP
jgi:hypothetical protein